MGALLGTDMRFLRNGWLKPCQSMIACEVQSLINVGSYPYKESIKDTGKSVVVIVVV